MEELETERVLEAWREPGRHPPSLNDVMWSLADTREKEPGFVVFLALWIREGEVGSSEDGSLLTREDSEGRLEDILENWDFNNCLKHISLVHEIIQLLCISHTPYLSPLCKIWYIVQCISG